jgi:chorismate mutase
MAVDRAGDAESPGGSRVTEFERELGWLDTEILDLIKRRIDLELRVGEARAEDGGPRFSHSHELAVVRRYAELGSVGHEVALLLLRLTRQTVAEREQEARTCRS